MSAVNRRNLLIGLALMLAFWAGFVLKPTKLANSKPSIQLETAIPKVFADWKIDETVVPIQADPERVALINKIYNQTLSRTYVNASGERVMLSIAYGGDQSDAMQVHRPEVCYTGNGFQMQDMVITTLETGFGAIPVKQVLATMSSRVEPITYWITIGNIVAVNTMKWKLEQLKYGLTGKVPDGLLFRVSSIGTQASQYPIQKRFVNDLLTSVSPEDRKRLIGSPTL